MADALPFRTQIRAMPRGKAGHHLYRDLARIHAGDHRRDPDFLRYVASKGAEILAITLVLKDSEALSAGRWSWFARSDDSLWVTTATQLLTERACRDIEAENVSWTPLVDALVANGAWDSDSAPVALYDLLGAIRTWVRTAESPRQLDPLLAFKTPDLLAVLAEYAPRLTWRQIDQLSEHPVVVGALARNPDAIQPYARRLIAKAWTVWQKSSPLTSETSSIGRAWLQLLGTLLEKGARLPAEMRSALFAELDRQSVLGTDPDTAKIMQNAIIAAVALDPGVSAADLTRLASFRPTGAALRSMLMAKHITRELAESLLDNCPDQTDGDNVLPFLQRFPDVSPQRLSAIVRIVSYPSPEFIRTIVQHPNANEQVWVDCLDSTRDDVAAYNVIDIVSSTPRCLESARVREIIRTADTVPPQPLIRLFPYANDPEEWRRIFSRLAQIDPRAAAKMLAPEAFRPDVRLTRDDLLPLLTSQAGEARLAALCALSNCQSADIGNLKPESRAPTR